MDLQDLPLDLIDHPPVEMRASVEQEYLEALASSIKEVGLLHPIRVTQKADRYEIVAGNCRYLAARMAGMVTIPAFLVVTHADNVPAQTLHENLMRRDVSPMDVARYLAHLKTTQGKSVDELARQFRYSTTWVYQHLKLMELDDEIKDAIDADRLNWQAGLELMRIENPDRRRSLLDSAVRAGATFQVVKGWVAQELVQLGLRPASPPVSLGNAMNLIPELTFTCALCLKVTPNNQMVTIRTCPEDYTTTMNAMKVLREQEHAASAATADGQV